MRQSWDILYVRSVSAIAAVGQSTKSVSSKWSTRIISVQVGTTFWLSWNDCMKEKLQPSSSSSPTFTRHTLCQHFLSFPTLPQVISLLLSHSFLPSSIESTSWLSHPVSLPLLFFFFTHLFCLCQQLKKAKTDDPAIKTYWQLLSEHIYQTHIRQLTQEWAHA